MSKYTHAFALFSNARSFLESAVRYARAKDKGEWKFALLHTVTAIELLVKARLAFEDPYLIARKTVDSLRFDRGEFQSINIDEAFQRLARVTGFSLTARSRATLNTLKTARNRSVHFTDIASPEQTRGLVAAGLAVFFEVHEAELDKEEDPYQARSMNELAQDLSQFSDFVTKRLESIAPKLQSSDRPRTIRLSECQLCLQDADVIDGDSIACLFCSHRLTIHSWAELLSEDGSVETCAVCRRPAVAKHRVRNEGATYECFCCGDFRGPEPRWADWNGQPAARLRATTGGLNRISRAEHQ